MSQITLLGIDTSKNKFSLHGLDEYSKTVLVKELSRDKLESYIANLKPCKIVMEACSGSHHWGRTFTNLGHTLSLIAPQKVVPFRMSKNKNDKNDAKAIALASQFPGMGFVAIKAIWQQDINALHKIRDRITHNQTALYNEVRGILAEYSVVIPVGISQIKSKLAELCVNHELYADKLSVKIRTELKFLHEEGLANSERLDSINKRLDEIVKTNETCKKLMKIEGVGAITATAILGNVVDINLFKTSRDFAAWLGLTPKHTQTGGKESKAIMGSITKKGNVYIRKLLVQGGMAVCGSIKRSQNKLPIGIKPAVPKLEVVAQSKEALFPHQHEHVFKKPDGFIKYETKKDWAKRLITEKGMQKASVAYANRNARVIWALLKRGCEYNPEFQKKAVVTA